MGTATWNTRWIHVIYVDYVDVKNSTWNIRWFYVEKSSSGGQILFNVESAPIFTLRSVRWIFHVESTSILRQKVSVRTWYIFKRRINVDSTSKSICADMVYFKRRFDVEISLSKRTVDSSTSNIRRSHVEVSPWYRLIFRCWMLVDSTLVFLNQ